MVKISIIPDSGTPFVIADEAKGEMVQFTGYTGTRTHQISKGFRAKKVSVNDRGNRQADFTFQVDRSHADLKTAQKFIRDHDGLVPSHGKILIKEEATRYLDDAQITQVALVRVNGVSTVFSYTVVGGQFQSTP